MLTIFKYYKLTATRRDKTKKFLYIKADSVGCNQVSVDNDHFRFVEFN